MVNETPEETPGEPTEPAAENNAENNIEQPAAEKPAADAAPPSEQPPVAERTPAAERTAESEGAEPPPADEPPTREQAAEEPVAEAPAPAEAGAETAPELTLGGGPPAEAEEPAVAPIVRGKVDRFGVAMGTGRRKTSVARVRIKGGNGQLTVNGRTLEDYCRIERDRRMIEAPLRATDTLGKVDVWVRVNGGGTTGQAGAMVLGIARALQAMEPNLHHPLAEGGYLTRDERMVERKKYGYKKARKSFQFSKR